MLSPNRFTRTSRSNARRLTALAAASALLIGTSGVMTGCDNAGQGAASGAALGALGGLAIGSLTGSAGKGAAIGAIAGGVGGAVLGDQNQRTSRPQYNEYHSPSGGY